jgi:hypothetical protein
MCRFALGAYGDGGETVAWNDRNARGVGEARRVFGHQRAAIRAYYRAAGA